jgi:N6-L-threonylcarbamoyladenine synthase
MKILAIDTSCDDTCVAVLDNDRILSSVISSQTNLHKDWGGVVPDIAKRSHQENILPVYNLALRRSHLKIGDIDVIAVTQGLGLSPCLGVGIDFAKKIAIDNKKKLIAVNHVEGHILANLLKNKNGAPVRDIQFPALALTVSGGHTQLVLVHSIGKYEIIGQTLDDAAGEALDKASKLLGLGYPGGPILETLSHSGDPNFLELPLPLREKKNYNFSFSGLKTSFYYQIRDWDDKKIAENINNLAATFQFAVFNSLVSKFKNATLFYQPKTLLASGGVLSNLTLRSRLRSLSKKLNLPIFMPFKKELNTDNAAMIGIVAYYKAQRGEYVANISTLDRCPRLTL